jgi:2-desacetyl-2-hydroxyethyl bacteriochlorophyllide A dehydrogenase
MSKIKYVLFESPCNAKIAETEIPEPDENQVLLRTSRSLISPGTELAYFEGKHTDVTTGKTKFPKTAPGYSAICIIEKAGKNIKDFKEGDRVLALSGHAGRSVTSAENLTPVPDGLDSESAVCGILGSIALHGLREANIQFGANVLITGLGIIGQIALRMARLCPARNIIAADMHQIRLDAAGDGGADHRVNLSSSSLKDAVDEITSGRGCETVIEASGSTKAIAAALKCAANRGKIVILGCPHGPAELELYMELQKRELSMVGSYQPNCPRTETGYTPWTQRKNRALTLEYLSRGRLDFSRIITHKMTWTRAPELYTLLSMHKDQAIGAVIDWDNERQTPA